MVASHQSSQRWLPCPGFPLARLSGRSFSQNDWKVSVLELFVLSLSLLLWSLCVPLPSNQGYMCMCACVCSFPCLQGALSQTRQLAAVPTKGSEINRPQPGKLSAFPSLKHPKRATSLLRNLARSPPCPVASSDCGKGLKEGRKSALSCHRKWGAKGWGSSRGRSLIGPREDQRTSTVGDSPCS